MNRVRSKANLCNNRRPLTVGCAAQSSSVPCAAAARRLGALQVVSLLGFLGVRQALAGASAFQYAVVGNEVTENGALHSQAAGRADDGGTSVLRALHSDTGLQPASV